MDSEERRAFNLLRLMHEMGYYSTHVVGTINEAGVRGLLVAFRFEEAMNDLEYLKAQLNGRLVEQGYFITRIEASDRVVYCHMAGPNEMREREM